MKKTPAKKVKNSIEEFEEVHGQPRATTMALRDDLEEDDADDLADMHLNTLERGEHESGVRPDTEVSRHAKKKKPKKRVDPFL